MEVNTPTIIFTGTGDDCVEAALFKYDNAIMRGRNENDKVACIFAYLSGEARASYGAKFIVGWLLAEQSCNYVAVCNRFASRYAKMTDADELFRIANKIRLDQDNSVKSLATTNKRFIATGSNDRARYGML